MTERRASLRDRNSLDLLFLKIDNSTPNDALRQMTLRKLKFESFSDDSFLKLARNFFESKKNFFLRDDRFWFQICLTWFHILETLFSIQNYRYLSDFFSRWSFYDRMTLATSLKWTAGKILTNWRVRIRTWGRTSGLNPNRTVVRDNSIFNFIQARVHVRCTPYMHVRVRVRSLERSCVRVCFGLGHELVSQLLW